MRTARRLRMKVFGLGDKQHYIAEIRNTTDGRPCNSRYTKRLTIPMFELKHKRTVACRPAAGRGGCALATPHE